MFDYFICTSQLLFLKVTQTVTEASSIVSLGPLPSLKALVLLIGCRGAGALAITTLQLDVSVCQMILFDYISN